MVACCLQWPLVGDAGMGAAVVAAMDNRHVAIAGLAGISLEEYAAYLSGQLMAQVGASQNVRLLHRVAVQEVLQDLADPSQARFGELRIVAGPASGAVRAKLTTGSALAYALAPLAVAQRRAHVEAAVLRVVRELTGEAQTTLSAETPLMEAGVDSLAATELSMRLQTATGLNLSPTIVFEQPTPRAVAAHLLEQLGGEATAVAATCAFTLASAADDMWLVLAGAEGRWPGGCDERHSRTRLRLACGDALVDVPATRWTLSREVDTATLTSVQAACVRHGGFVSGADRFDERAFGISRAEASAMDPQQRFLLEHGYGALHTACERRATLMGGDSGVFVCIERPDWALAQPPSARS